MEERRISVRIEFEPHVEASITCIDANENIVTDSACICDVGLEGLGIISKVDLQEESEIIVCTMLPNLRKNLILEGSIVRKEYTQDGFVYGVQLFMDEGETEQLLDFLEEVRSGESYVKCSKHTLRHYEGPNRREYYRIDFFPHAKAVMRILSPGQYRYDWSQTDICIMDFSATGIKFKTDKDFAVDASMLVSVDIQICGENLNVIGSIVRKHLDEKPFVYAMQFIAPEDAIAKHVGIVNKLLVAKKNGEMHKNYVICSCR